MHFAEHYTTIVVGAGPAGVMAALHAASAGSVLLVDSFELPRDKSCGGMLNEYSQAFLRRFGELPRDMFCEPETIDFRFFDWDRNIKKPSALHFKNVERKAFDAWLTGLLPENVTVASGTRFTGCWQDRASVNVHVQAASEPDGAPQTVIGCEWLIGCDGPRSAVRRALPVSQLKLYKTLQDYLPLEGPVEPYFDCLYARGIGQEYGYGYFIPKGDVCIVGSVFYPETTNNKQRHEKAVALYSSYYPYTLEPVKREAWTAVKVQSAADIVGGWGRVLLAGEAGGIMSPSSGEGISFALNSGSYAGTAVALAQHGKLVGAPAASPSISSALWAYREAIVPIKRNIARRLRYYPVLDSDFGKYLAGFSPAPLVDYVAHRI